ncbi:hypothetical protein CK203_056629 [Vitis vinifera]|uniref:Retrovirus-related Pol polyprotein from transposon TNT 1-94 n=1 Tax=Vitis vinifera TaxID=29760 RepID=A0A438GNT1_VITVI|nr:hypothetical protein CK203_056629 [Vitis vinifera]
MCDELKSENQVFKNELSLRKEKSHPSSKRLSDLINLGRKPFDKRGLDVMLGMFESFQRKLTNLMNGSFTLTNRLGHLNYRDLMKVANNEVIKAIPKIGKPSNPIRSTSQKRKQTRNAHRRVDEILASKPLKLFYMDLMGPMRIESLGGKKYILVMVDDYSRKTCYELWKCKKPSVKYFRVFGSRCHVLKDHENLDTIMILLLGDASMMFEPDSVVDMDDWDCSFDDG